MKTQTIEQIQDITSKVNLKDPRTIDHALLQILGEDQYVHPGNEVAIIDDPTYSFPGQKGKVKGISSKGGGYVDVELANGTTVAVLSNQIFTL